jgi:hypothetical protein
MRKLLILWSLFLVCIVSLSQPTSAQLSMTGAGPGGPPSGGAVTCTVSGAGNTKATVSTNTVYTFIASAADGVHQYVPVNGSTRCKMAPRQTSTTSNLSRFDSRRSLANLSMAQKQIAPMTTIIKTPIKTEIITIPRR